MINALSGYATAIEDLDKDAPSYKENEEAFEKEINEILSQVEGAPDVAGAPPAEGAAAAPPHVPKRALPPQSFTVHFKLVPTLNATQYYLEQVSQDEELDTKLLTSFDRVFTEKIQAEMNADDNYNADDKTSIGWISNVEDAFRAIKDGYCWHSHLPQTEVQFTLSASQPCVTLSIYFLRRRSLFASIRMFYACCPFQFQPQ